MRVVRLCSAVFVLLLCACDAPPPQSTPGAAHDAPAAAAAPQPPERGRLAKAGEMCGGLAGFTCGEKLYCSMDTGRCDLADDSGVCKPRPEMCTREYAPVCACDGKTYGNACEAAAAGARLLRDGAC